MGDGADLLLDQVERFEELRCDYHMGRITDIEAYEHGIVDELGYEIPSGSHPRPKTCRCCGTTGLAWSKANGKWRLFDGDKLHDCPVNPLH